MPRVAVASTDGIFVNEHFGRCKNFLIYEVKETGEYKYVEQRENKPRSASSKEHPTTAQLLADVEAILVKRIGPGAELELHSYGIIALSVSGPIDKALNSYGKRVKFIRNNISRANNECLPTSGGGCLQGRGRA